MSKAITAFFGGMGLFGALAVIGLAFFSLGLSLYGLYLAFSASIILGLFCLFLEPSPLVFGVAMFFFDKNLPELIINWLNS